MTWPMSPRVKLMNDRIPHADAKRQMVTAAEILKRLEHQPGVVLADEVGMGKTYVALAVAASVIEATRHKGQVVVLVPSGVANKWVQEWGVFEERCLAPEHGIRASGPVQSGNDFLKLLDDPAPKRKHIIFMTHGALTRKLSDNFIELAILREAMRSRSKFNDQRAALPRFASRLFPGSGFDEVTASALIARPISEWQSIWNSTANRRKPLDDDPVPLMMQAILRKADLDEVREVLRKLPLRSSAYLDQRIREIRQTLQPVFKDVWGECLRHLGATSPLLILDEAHHVKNQNQLARLFTGEDDLKGPLGQMFSKMLFLTATPFQLGHHELLAVLGRFDNVRWSTRAAEEEFLEAIEALGHSLNEAQARALQFETAWSRMGDHCASTARELDRFDIPQNCPEELRAALARGAAAKRSIDSVSKKLRPWVIRHSRTNGSGREYREGEAILDGGDGTQGLSIDRSATLPFLLAARAQAVATLSRANSKGSRSYFAYGLSSSYEAYSDTRRNRLGILDDIRLEEELIAEDTAQLRWYLDQIEDALPEDKGVHPKMAATVRRVTDLWKIGEKVLVFCFYVETGRALRFHISKAISDEILSRARMQLSLPDEPNDVVSARLDAIATRLLRIDSPGYRTAVDAVLSIANDLDDDTQEKLLDGVVRYMRTSSFLVKNVRLDDRDSAAAIRESFNQSDGSGLTFRDQLRNFVEFLSDRIPGERTEILDAFTRIDTRESGTGGDLDVDDPTDQRERRGLRIPNVRLANGRTKDEQRQRIMTAFNTPFLPEVLVASAVMGEGVNLHQACRHVIHHDLDWNPSTLEQRTGRVDRLGSKSVITGQPVVVFEPYLGGTHDEKMFKVVKDRERWFGIVMGSSERNAESELSAVEAQVPLPAPLAEQLTINLGLQSAT